MSEFPLLLNFSLNSLGITYNGKVPPLYGVIKYRRDRYHDQKLLYLSSEVLLLGV